MDIKIPKIKIKGFDTPKISEPGKPFESTLPGIALNTYLGIPDAIISPKTYEPIVKPIVQGVKNIARFVKDPIKVGPEYLANTGKMMGDAQRVMMDPNATRDEKAEALNTFTFPIIGATAGMEDVSKNVLRKLTPEFIAWVTKETNPAIIEDVLYKMSGSKSIGRVYGPQLAETKTIPETMNIIFKLSENVPRVVPRATSSFSTAADAKAAESAQATRAAETAQTVARKAETQAINDLTKATKNQLSVNQAIPQILYRGTAPLVRPPGGEIYVAGIPDGSGEPMAVTNVLGEATYLAPDRTVAERFAGPTGKVTEYVNDLKNPLVLNSDADFYKLQTDLFKKLGSFPDPLDITLQQRFGGEPGAVAKKANELQQAIKDLGYDGVVVNLDGKNGSNGTLTKYFQDSQVIAFNEPIKKAFTSTEKSVSPGVTGPGHDKLNRFLDGMVKNQTILPEDRDIIQAVFSNTADSFFTPHNYSENARLRSTLGRFSRVFGPGFGGPRPLIETRLQMQTGISRRFGEKYADTGAAKVVLHEFGHAGWWTTLNQEERDMVTDLWMGMSKSEQRGVFTRGVTDAPGQDKYYASNEREFFAESFAQYVMENKVPVEKMRSLLKRVSKLFFDSIKRLVYRGKEAAVEKMRPLFEKILKGDKSTPLSEFAEKEPPSFKKDLQAMFDKWEPKWNEPTAPKPSVAPTPAPTKAIPFTPPVQTAPVPLKKGVIAHYTLAKNIPSILREGFDVKRNPIHAVGGLGGGEKTAKIGKDVLYFTTDTGRWNTAQIYVGEGKGNISREVYDYKKQEWVTEKDAYIKADLTPVEATIKPNAKILVVDTLAKAQEVAGAGNHYTEGILEPIIENAKKQGYDIVNIKNPGDIAWDLPNGRTNKYGNTNVYKQATGNSGNDDYFVINHKVLDIPGMKGEFASGTARWEEPKPFKPLEIAPAREEPKPTKPLEIAPTQPNNPETATKWEMPPFEEKPPVKLSAEGIPLALTPREKKIVAQAGKPTTPKQPIKLDEEVYAKNREVEKKKQTTLELTKELGKDISEKASKLMTPLSTRLYNLHPSLKRDMRSYEFHLSTKTARDLAQAEPFMKKVRSMKPGDYSDLDLALKNRDASKTREIIKKYGLELEFENVKNTLNRLIQAQNAAGFDVGTLPNYFPRQVKDPKKFLEYIETNFTKEETAPLKELLKAKEDELGRALTDSEKAEIVDVTINPETRIIFTTGGMKPRTIQFVDGELNQFYLDSEHALYNYINRTNDAIESWKFFNPLGKRNKFDTIKNSIATYVIDKIVKGTIKPNEAEELTRLLQARFQDKGTSGFVTKVKNLAYIDTMGSFVSALTQFQDLAFSIYRAGLLTTGKEFGKSIFGKSKITLSDLGADKIAQEFSNPGSDIKLLTNVFKFTGLSALDNLTSETLANSVISKYRKQALNPTPDFTRRLQKVFGKETGQIIADLKSGKTTENIKYLAFNELLDIQPKKLSEMPEKYLTAGNGRIMYMLKTFQLKLFDVYRNEVFAKEMRANPKNAMKNFMKLTAILVLAGMSTDQIKDWALGRKTTIEDRVADNLFKLVGFSKWTIYKARQEGLPTAMMQTLLPPMKLANSLYKDITSFPKGGFNDLKTIQSIPHIGKAYYYWFGGGQTKTTPFFGEDANSTKVKIPSVKIPSVKTPKIKIPSIKI